MDESLYTSEFSIMIQSMVMGGGSGGAPAERPESISLTEEAAAARKRRFS
jgi:hypothetical protein